MKGIIEKLEMQGFEGYKKAEIPFTAGLNLITGRNSTGKTTILDAIFFALYGEIPDVDKKLLVTRLQGTSKTLYVGLRFISPKTNQIVEVKRWGKLYFKRGKEGYQTERLILLIDGKETPVSGEEELRKKITDLLGLTMKRFLNLTYVRQGELTKILKPDKDEMDSILGITILKELIEELNLVKKELEKYEEKDVETEVKTINEVLLPKVKEQIKNLESQIETLKHEIKEVQDKLEKAESPELINLLKNIDEKDSLLKSFREKEASIKILLTQWSVPDIVALKELIKKVEAEEQELKRKLKEENEELKKVEVEKENYKDRLVKVKELLKSVKVSNVEKLKELIEKKHKENSKINEDLILFVKKFNEIEEEKNRLEGKLLTLIEELKAHKKLLEENKLNCPMCGQKVTPETLKKLILEKEVEKKEVEQKFANIIKIYEEKKKVIEKLKYEISKLENELETLMGVNSLINESLAGSTLKELEETYNKTEQKYQNVKCKIEELTIKFNEVKTKLLNMSLTLENAKNFLKKLKKN